jgi:hypothetical protein
LTLLDVKWSCIAGVAQQEEADKHIDGNHVGEYGLPREGNEESKADRTAARA